MVIHPLICWLQFLKTLVKHGVHLRVRVNTHQPLLPGILPPMVLTQSEKPRIRIPLPLMDMYLLAISLTWWLLVGWKSLAELLLKLSRLRSLPLNSLQLLKKIFQQDQLPPLIRLLHQLVPFNSLLPQSLQLSPLSIYSEPKMKFNNIYYLLI